MEGNYGAGEMAQEFRVTSAFAPVSQPRGF